MRRRLIVIVMASALFLSVMAGAASAGQNAIGAGFSSGDPGTVGPGISGDFFGNTSNPSGNGEGVLPSLSPGPWVCGDPLDCAGPTDPGGSVGDFLAPLASGTATPTFANGNDLDLDFSG